MQAHFQPHAGFFQRSAAFIIDLAILHGVLWVLRQIVLSFYSSEPPLDEDLISHIWIFFTVSCVLIIAYFVLGDTLLPATPGKIIMRIRTFSDKGLEMGFATALLRNFVKIIPLLLLYYTLQMIVVEGIQAGNISGSTVPDNVIKQYSLAILGIGALMHGMMLVTKRKQALHDLIANTIVVKTHDNPLKELYLKLSKFVQRLRRSDDLHG